MGTSPSPALAASRFAWSRKRRQAWSFLALASTQCPGTPTTSAVIAPPAWLSPRLASNPASVNTFASSLSLTFPLLRELMGTFIAPVGVECGGDVSDFGNDFALRHPEHAVAVKWNADVLTGRVEFDDE